MLTDIAIVRPPYWPGLDEGWAKIKQFPSFNEFRKEMIDERGMFRKDKVQSDFVMAWTTLCSAWSKFGDEYARAANPEFLERTLKGLVNYCFYNRKTQESIAEGIAEFKANLPLIVHHRLEPLIEEKDWPDFNEFR